MFLEIRDLKKSYGEGDNRVDVLKDMWQLMERKRQI